MKTGLLGLKIDQHLSGHRALKVNAGLPLRQSLSNLMAVDLGVGIMGADAAMSLLTVFSSSN